MLTAGTLAAVLVGFLLIVVSCALLGWLDHKKKKRRDDERDKAYRDQIRREALEAGYYDVHEYMWKKYAELNARRPDYVKLKGLS